MRQTEKDLTSVIREQISLTNKRSSSCNHFIRVTCCLRLEFELFSGAWASLSKTKRRANILTSNHRLMESMQWDQVPNPASDLESASQLNVGLHRKWTAVERRTATTGSSESNRRFQCLIVTVSWDNKLKEFFRPAICRRSRWKERN